MAHSSIRRPGLIVYFCGVGTSFLALWLVELINNHGENIMGWYANGIIPAGALLVGICSGVGYAIGARWLNVKLSKAFVMGMLTTGLIDYVAAQWVTYMNILERYHVDSNKYSFVAYIRDICENMSFQSSGSKEAGTALGMFGYFFKALEMAGFAFGSMIPCAVLRGMPYCFTCQRYLKKHAEARFHSPILSTEIKKLPRDERAAAVQTEADAITARAVGLLQKIAPLPLEETLSALKQSSEAPLKKSTAWVHVQLSKCPQCDRHHVASSLYFVAANGKPGQAALAPLDKTRAHDASGAAMASAPTAS